MRLLVGTQQAAAVVVEAEQHGGGGGAGGSGGPPPIESGPKGMHQHYQHYDAGAFMPQKQNHPNQGYYKVSTPEQFAADGGGGGGGGGGFGGTSKQAGVAAPPPINSNVAALKALGKEPKLNGEADQNVTAPPQAVTINQATTQDLSLPEDEFQRKSTPTKPSPISREVGNAVKRGGRMIMNRAYGMGAGAMGSVHF